MFFSDYHTHTNFSSDSDTPMEAMVDCAVALGLKEIAFTDHVDIDYPNLDTIFTIDYQEYANAIKKFKEKYQEKINIKIGVEIGLQPHIQKEVHDLTEKNFYDFVIGSTHAVDKKELYGNDFFQGLTQKEAYRRYFEDVLNSVTQFNEFCVYGHIDYINRYGDYGNRVLVYEDYEDITDEILKKLIQKGKGLEINTSGFKYGLGYAHPQLPLLKRYRQLGGEIITIGSDAHGPEHIAFHFDYAYQMLQAAGFRYFTVFTNQKPEFLPLDKFVRS